MGSDPITDLLQYITFVRRLPQFIFFHLLPDQHFLLRMRGSALYKPAVLLPHIRQIIAKRAKHTLRIHQLRHQLTYLTITLLTFSASRSRGGHEQPVAAVLIIRGMLHNLSFYRIQMDVSAYLKKVMLTVDQRSRIPPLENMPMKVMPEIEFACINAQELLHDYRQMRILCFDRHMKMVCHKTQGMNCEWVLIAHIAENFKKIQIVGAVLIDRCFSDAATHDMINRTRKPDSFFSSHNRLPLNNREQMPQNRGVTSDR